MMILFYIAAIVAIMSTLMVITRSNAVHALLYLVVSLLSVAVIFFIMGAPFVAALEVIIYAGAIMVLFIFVVMMLNLEGEALKKERLIIKPSSWLGPGILTLILLVEFIIIFTSAGPASYNNIVVTPKQVGISLFGKYMLGVELAAMLLMAGIVGAYHLGKGRKRIMHRYLEKEETE